MIPFEHMHVEILSGLSRRRWQNSQFLLGKQNASYDVCFDMVFFGVSYLDHSRFDRIGAEQFSQIPTRPRRPIDGYERGSVHRFFCLLLRRMDEEKSDSARSKLLERLF